MQVTFQNLCGVRVATIEECGERAGYSVQIRIAPNASDLQSLQASANEARIKAARELRRAERIEQAIATLKGQ